MQASVTLPTDLGYHRTIGALRMAAQASVWALVGTIYHGQDRGRCGVSPQRVFGLNEVMLVRSLLVILALVAFSGAGQAQRGGASGYTEDRIIQLQQAVTDLTRRIQELQRQNQQLQQQLEKMQASYEQRLERLEKGTAAKPPPPRKAPAKP